MARTIAAGRLAEALELHGEGIRVLSLDCFDTLVWRATHAPVDVFADLRPDPGLRCRGFAESMARQLKRLTHWQSEVTLREIHRQLVGRDDAAAIEAGAAAELAAERRHCYGFAPTAELIRRAVARGLRVIVVSDTYLDAVELRALIASAAGDEIAAMIERVFCSSEHGLSKAEGLFRHVLAELGVPPAQVLHAGDNPTADHEAPNALGIRGLHVEQFPAALEQQLRLEAAIGAVIDPGTRIERPALQLHRAPLALEWGEMPDAGARVGFGSLGPVLHGFAHWVRAELEALRAGQSARVRPLFLLRDGHLPQRVFEALPGSAALPHARVEISRFASFAASFSDERAVLAYLAEFGGTRRFDAMANQLLLTPSEAAQLGERARRAERPLEAFVAEVRKPYNLRKIFDRSSAYATRLVTYLRKAGGVADGDTLVLVDLGYAGTVQDRLAPVLRERLGAEVVGRYLALRDVPRWREDKRGFIGPDRYDFRTLDALCAYIAVVEQLCTVEQASVVDYTAEGEPIRKDSDLKTRQSHVRAAAQAGCLRYVERFEAAFERKPAALDVDALRQTACAALARLLFLPSQDELELFAGFEHDVNMGVRDKVTLFDPGAAHEGLLRRGLFYTNDNPRQYLPAEIRGQGMELSLSLLMLRRFGLDLRHRDFEPVSRELPIMVADGTRVTPASVTAYPTHDGFYMAAVPVGASRFAIGLRFGELFEWVQLHSLTFSRADALMGDGDLAETLDACGGALLEGVELHSGGLLRCAEPQGFVFVPPPRGGGNESYVLTAVFRPLADRAPEAAAAPASAAGASARPAAGTAVT